MTRKNNALTWLLIAALICPGCDVSTTKTTGGESSQPPDSEPSGTEATPLSPKEGRELLRENRFSEARIGIQAYLVSHPADLDAELVKAVAMAGEGDHPGAEEYLEPIRREHPDDVRVHAVAALILIGKGEIEQAIQEAESALENHPSSEELHHILLMAYEQKGDEFKTRQHFARLAEINPEYDGVPVAGGWDAVKEWLDEVGLVVSIVGAVVAILTKVAERASR